MTPGNMTEENTLKYGARNVLAPDTKVEILSLTKKEFYAANPYLTGTAVNDSAQVLVCFLDNNMDAHKTVRSGLIKIKTPKGILTRVVQIVKKDQPYTNYYNYYLKYKAAGLIHPTLLQLLNPNESRKNALSQARAIVSIVLTLGVIEFYGSVAEAAARTKVPADLLRLWIKLNEVNEFFED